MRPRDDRHRQQLEERAAREQDDKETAAKDPAPETIDCFSGRITEKAAARHFPGIAIDDLYQDDGRWQLYSCGATACGHQVGMKLLHRGVTPFMMACEKCGQPAQSSGQQDDLPIGYQASGSEWRQLDAAEMEYIRRKDPAYYDHLQQGGLAAVHIGKRVDAKTAKTRPATSMKHRLPKRNDYCPCDSGRKYKRCCITLGPKERDERWAAAEEARPKKVPPRKVDQAADELVAAGALTCDQDTNGDGDCGRPTCPTCHPENHPLAAAIPGDDLVPVYRYRCRDCTLVTSTDYEAELIRCPSCNGKAMPA